MGRVCGRPVVVADRSTASLPVTASQRPALSPLRTRLLLSYALLCMVCALTLTFFPCLPNVSVPLLNLPSCRTTSVAAHSLTSYRQTGARGREQECNRVPASPMSGRCLNTKTQHPTLGSPPALTNSAWSVPHPDPRVLQFWRLISTLRFITASRSTSTCTDIIAWCRPARELFRWLRSSCTYSSPLWESLYMSSQASSTNE